MEESKKFKDICGMLPVGKSNAISWQALASLLGVNGQRQVQKIIEIERNNGKIIAANPKGGYFIPETRDELQEYYRVEAAKAKSHFRSLKSVAQALNKIQGQTSFTEDLEDL